MPFVSLALLTGAIGNQANAQVPTLRNGQETNRKKQVESAQDAAEENAATAAWKALLAEDELWNGRRAAVAKVANSAERAGDKKVQKEAEARLAAIDENHKARLLAIKEEHGDLHYKAAVERLKVHREKEWASQGGDAAMKANPAWKSVLAEEELWRERREANGKDARDAERAGDRKAQKEAEARLAAIDENHKARLSAIKEEHGDEHYKAAIEALRSRRQETKAERDQAQQLVEKAAEAKAAEAKARQDAAMERAKKESEAAKETGREVTGHEVTERAGEHGTAAGQAAEEKAAHDQMERAQEQYEREVEVANKEYEERLKKAKEEAASGKGGDFEKKSGELKKKHDEKMVDLEMRHAERKAMLGKKLDELKARGRRAKEAGEHPGKGSEKKGGAKKGEDKGKKGGN